MAKAYQEDSTIQIDKMEVISVPMDELEPGQGELKTSTAADTERLYNRILAHGFKYPLFVWKRPRAKRYVILDGHQRYKALQYMLDEGHIITTVPCVAVVAATEKLAKQEILALAGNYAKVTEEGLKSFLSMAGLSNVDFDLEQFSFPKVDFNLSWPEEVPPTHEDELKDDAGTTGGANQPTPNAITLNLSAAQMERYRGIEARLTEHGYDDLVEAVLLGLELLVSKKKKR